MNLRSKLYRGYTANPVRVASSEPTYLVRPSGSPAPYVSRFSHSRPASRTRSHRTRARPQFGLYQIPVGFALALSITNCTRLLLNIRRAYYSGAGDPLLVNIRDIPNTGANTPNMLDAPPSSTSLIPLTPPPITMSPLSATSGLSGETLRERSVTPAGALRPTSQKRASTLANAHALRISIATTSSEMIQVAPRFTYEHERADEEGAEAAHEEPRAVYVTPNLDSGWWQYELREMRADPEIAPGEAL